jgi:hypothetical protein
MDIRGLGVTMKNRGQWIVRSFIWVYFIIFSSHLTFSTAGEDKKHLVLVTPGSTTNLHVRWATEVYTKALQKLGYSFSIRRCEPMLCTQLANRGEVDGELMRVALYQSLVPKMVRLSEFGLSVTWSAYSVDNQLKFQNWQQIRDSGLRVTYLAGASYLEQKLSTVSDATRVTKIRHWSLGLDRLKRGETDIYVGSKEIIANFLGRPEYDGIYRAGMIETTPLYLYLNKKHSQLAVELSQVITEMKQQGQTNKIYQAIVLERAADISERTAE